MEFKNNLGFWFFDSILHHDAREDSYMLYRGERLTDYNNTLGEFSFLGNETSMDRKFRLNFDFRVVSFSKISVYIL